MKTTHNGTEIEYDERENLWRFTLRDRDRSAESLAKAKEIIDKPEPKEKARFDRLKIWLWKWGQAPIKAEITGIAERTRYNRTGLPDVWITSNGSRSKHSQYDCFERTPALDQATNEWLEIQAKIDAMIARQTKIKEALKSVNIV